MALAYLTLGERRFYTSSGTWPISLVKHPVLGVSEYRTFMRDFIEYGGKSGGKSKR